MGRSMQIGDHDVDVAIVIEIAKSSTASGPCVFENSTHGGGDIDEPVLGKFQQHGGLQRVQVRLSDLDIVHHVAVGNKDFLDSIVVIIESLNAPAAIWSGRCGQASAYRRVVELPFAEVVKQGVVFVGQGCGEDVRQAVVIQIGKDRTHPREGLAVFGIGDAGGKRDIRKGAVTVVAEQNLWRRVVGDVDVEPAIVIEVAK